MKLVKKCNNCILVKQHLELAQQFGGNCRGKFDSGKYPLGPGQQNVEGERMWTVEKLQFIFSKEKMLGTNYIVSM